ncbi:glycosyl transferase family 1 [Mucilaginibacter oryzae]|uniref:Glycosyl transferase family 1 n=1 Tax=Mucilaginibacter oryzae TaxID=468058 RepID=A0A316HDD9_9SPHI|nr:glycosyltransferase [Mucilaginibacter oryzae]PWK79174.1 glycosyl transferase family 1 [Mucilaginibacter oryzae]
MNERIKTLVILSPGFPENEEDTTCLPPQQVFVRSLKAEYPQLHVIVLSFQYPFAASEYDWYGVKVIAFGGGGRDGFTRRKLWFKVWNTLLRLNHQYQLVGLLSFWLDECAFIAHYFSKFKRIRYRCWMLGQDAKAGNRYVKWIKPEAGELIALSDFMVEEFNRNYGLKPEVVITVGIDTRMFNFAPVTRDIDIIGAGSLIPLKRFGLFIEVVALLKQSYPGIKTAICGSGPEQERLQALIIAKKLENNIRLMGELPHSELLEMMQRSKILFHPSEYEGFGAVFLEALYAGASVVSFVKPMNNEITNWRIVNTLLEAEQAIGSLLGDTGLEFEAVLPFDIRDNVRRMMELFE